MDYTVQAQVLRYLVDSMDVVEYFKVTPMPLLERVEE